MVLTHQFVTIMHVLGSRGSHLSRVINNINGLGWYHVV